MLQREHQTPDPRKAGFEELVSEWLRLAKQAEADETPQPRDVGA